MKYDRKQQQQQQNYFRIFHFFPLSHSQFVSRGGKEAFCVFLASNPWRCQLTMLCVDIFFAVCRCCCFFAENVAQSNPITMQHSPNYYFECIANSVCSMCVKWSDIMGKFPLFQPPPPFRPTPLHPPSPTLTISHNTHILEQIAILTYETRRNNRFLSLTQNSNE